MAEQHYYPGGHPIPERVFTTRPPSISTIYTISKNSITSLYRRAIAFMMSILGACWNGVLYITGVSAQTRVKANTLYEMFSNVITGDFQLSFWSYFKLIFIIGYILNPIDLIPDFLLLVGLIDDAILLRFSINWFDDDLDRYNKWKTNCKIIKN